MSSKMAAPMRKHVLDKIINNWLCSTHQRCLSTHNVNQAAKKTKKVASVAAPARDPGPEFIRPEVQSILQAVTGMERDRVFKTRYTEGVHPPHYKLLTNKQLQELEQETEHKTRDRLQMPPILKAREEVADVLSNDAEIDGFDTHKTVFTDIATNVNHKDRVIVIRETDGVLRHAKPSERDRLLQAYYPQPGRMMYMPSFLQAQNLEVMLERGRYEYILDVACVQFEPDEPDFVRVTQRTYEHVSSNNAFEELRSTRFFGCLAFHLAWYNKLEPLLADTLDRERLEDTKDLLQLFCLLHPDSKAAKALTPDMPLKKALQVFLTNDSKNPPPLEDALSRMEEKNKPKSSAKASAQ